jgi:succinate dehydrogenase / fumarate reductase, flavoprotein subunit
MFDDIPENYRAQTADEEKGWRYTQGDKSARRPPELLTRDHVARCIVREVREGRGSPHGGVFLDIAWIKQRLPGAEEHIRKKLPSMYHQFKQLADIDITTTPMEVGPTTHYMMGGVRVDGETQMSTVPGLFAAGECAAGCTAPTGSAATRSPTCSSSASAPASMRPSTRGRRRRDPWTKRCSRALRGRTRAVRARGTAARAVQIQHDLQEMMQDLVGIVRTRGGDAAALERIGSSGSRRAASAWQRQPRVQPRLAHRARSAQPAHRLRGDHARGIERRESRGGTSARTTREGPGVRAASTSWSAGDGEMRLRREPIPRDARPS